MSILILRWKNKQAVCTCRHDALTKQKIVAAAGILGELQNRDQHLKVSSHSSLHWSAKLHLQDNTWYVQDCGCGAELDSIAQFIAKIKIVMVYNFYVRNTNILKYVREYQTLKYVRQYLKWHLSGRAFSRARPIPLKQPQRRTLTRSAMGQGGKWAWGYDLASAGSEIWITHGHENGKIRTAQWKKCFINLMPGIASVKAISLTW